MQNLDKSFEEQTIDKLKEQYPINEDMVKITRKGSKAYISFQNFSNRLNPWTKAYPLFKENGEVTEGVLKNV